MDKEDIVDKIEIAAIEVPPIISAIIPANGVTNGKTVNHGKKPSEAENRKQRIVDVTFLFFHENPLLMSMFTNRYL